jgi:hypothetical protein
MSTDLQTQHLQTVVSCDPALSCHIRLDVCNGDDPEIKALRRRAVLDGNTLSASSLIELVGNFGVRAECTRLDWNGLTKSGLSYPILVFLKNTNAVAVTGTDSAAADAVSVWDPLHSDGEVLSVRREDFERAWTGDALVIARQPSTGAEASTASSTERDIEALDPPPEHGGERAPWRSSCCRFRARLEAREVAAAHRHRAPSRGRHWHSLVDLCCHGRRRPHRDAG